MRGTFSFDIAEQNYGPATLAVRQILSTWVSVDWFSGQAGEPEHALELFMAHQSRAHMHQPNLFPKDITINTSTRSFNEFDALVLRVRQPSDWDWRMRALKELTRQHAKARGWVRKEYARTLQPEGGQRPGQLYLRFADSVLCALGPKLEPIDAPKETHWYHGYAVNDFWSCIEWQLAEGHDNLEENPFFPLVLCYMHGFYPFSFSRTSYELCVPKP